MEIKNKLTVTSGRGERDNGERRGSVIKEHVLRTHGQSQRRVGLGVGGGGRWGGEEWWQENGDNCN